MSIAREAEYYHVAFEIETCNVLMFLCVVKQNVFCGVVAPPEIEPWPNLLWLPRGADTHQLMYCIHDLMTGL